MSEIQSVMQDVLYKESQIQKASNDPARFMYHNARADVAKAVNSDVAQYVFIGTKDYDIVLTRNTSL